MVRDSERAGESQKTEKRAADAAANPKSPFPIDLSRSLNSDSSPEVASLLREHCREEEEEESLRLKLKRRFELGNRRECERDEMGTVDLGEEIGEKWGGLTLRPRLGQRGSIFFFFGGLVLIQ